MKLLEFSGKKSWVYGLSMLTLGLAGCGGDSSSRSGSGDDSDEAAYEYRVTITNLTAGQPLSPLAVVLHNSNWQAFELGEPASVGIEKIAEAGSRSDFLEAADDSADVYASKAGKGAIGPGESGSVTIATDTSGTFELTLVSMMENTNDAITALNGADISSLLAGESASYRIISYDTGTEANSESADTIPGPAAVGGAREGYNAARDDVRDAVYVHPGVVTSDDGLATSTLTEAHRWDNPVASVVISRIR